MTPPQPPQEKNDSSTVEGVDGKHPHFHVQAKEDLDLDNLVSGASASVECRFCLKPIPRGARVCFLCRTPQFWVRLDPLGAGAVASLILSLSFLLVSLANYSVAARRMTEAREALEVATEASEKAKQAVALKSELEVLKEDFESYITTTFRTTCNSFGGIFDGVSGECISRTGERFPLFMVREGKQVESLPD